MLGSGKGPVPRPPLPPSRHTHIFVSMADRLYELKAALADRYEIKKEIAERRKLGTVVILMVLFAAWGSDPNNNPTPCDRVVGDELAPSRDLYCMTMVAVPGMESVSGTLELGRIPSVFTTNVTQDGRHRFDAILTLDGLPDPTTLGEFNTYVAWAVTPDFSIVDNLGHVSNGTNHLEPIDLNKFRILVSAEVSANGAERSGRLVMRSASASTRMRPPDLMEFLYGAGSFEADGARAPVNGAWIRPPSPPGLTMMPALMMLDAPAVAPYLPSPETDAPAARPFEVVRMEDGDTLYLEAGLVSRSIRGRTFQMYGFNGQYPGPLIWVQQGATITVLFSNAIDMPTAVHWHGIRIENEFDGVPGLTQDPVLPGQSFEYRIRFPDAGIYWYHPHVREDVQQDLGLYGNIMIRSPRPDYFSPANSEQVLILDDILIGDQGLIPYGTEAATHAMMGRFGNQFLINGEPDYSLNVGRGEVVRFFLTNVSNTRTFNLSFGGAPIKVVGTDVGNFEAEEWAESVVIAPAERYIVHVSFPDAGSYAMENRIQAIDHRSGSFFSVVDTLGRVTVSRNVVAPDLATAFETLRSDSYVISDVDRFRELFDKEPDEELILTMETEDLPFVVGRFMQFDSTYFAPVEWAGTMPMMNWASTPDQVRWILRDARTGLENMDIAWDFKVGDVVKIRLSNEREVIHAMQHPIHFHGQRFLIVSQNGVANTNLAWKDTMLLPVGSTADILLDVTNPGNWMVHCHIAEHLETGMMMAFTVN